MRMPDPIWSMTYSAKRRKHHHRCFVCRRVIQDGEPVLMARTRTKVTKCIHETCSDSRATPNGFTARDLLEAHGMQYLARCGWADAQRFLETAPICTVGGAPHPEATA